MTTREVIDLDARLSSLESENATLTAEMDALKAENERLRDDAQTGWSSVEEDIREEYAVKLATLKERAEKAEAELASFHKEWEQKREYDLRVSQYSGEKPE